MSLRPLPADGVEAASFAYDRMAPNGRRWSESPVPRPAGRRVRVAVVDDPCITLDSYAVESSRRFAPAWTWAYYTSSYDPAQTSGSAPYVNGAGTFFLRDMWTSTQNVQEVIRLRPVVAAAVDHTTVNRLSLTLGLNVLETTGADFVGGISVIVQTWSGTVWQNRSTLGDFAAMNAVGSYEYTQLETAAGVTWAQLVGFFNDGTARLAVYAQGYIQSYACYDMEVTKLCAQFVTV